jgi:hypothetical protein
MRVHCNNPECKFHRGSIFGRQDWCATDKITLQLKFFYDQEIDGLLRCYNYQPKEEECLSDHMQKSEQ